MDSYIPDYLQSEQRAEDFIVSITDAQGPPTFEEAKIREKFNSVMTMRFRSGQELTLFDSEHAIEQFFDRFDLPMGEYKDVVKKGMAKIFLGYKMEPGNYTIVSRSRDIKIPIDLRPDRYDPSKIVAVTPTTLRSDQVYNIRGDIQIIVEGVETNEEIKQKLTEASLGRCVVVEDHSDVGKGMPFQHIFEDGEYKTTFIEIEVD